MDSSIQDKYIPIVLCAGFGSRLKPLTDFIPKVVCPLIDKPFAFYNIEKFFKAGFQTVHCNTHYLSEIVRIELINACLFFGYDPNRIRFWHEDEILETGGGITRIFKELCLENPSNKNKDLIVCSGDIVADFPLQEMISRWENKKDKDLALLCTKNMQKYRKDGTHVGKDLTHVLGFGEKFLEERRTQDLITRVFTNHQIVSGEIVEKCAVEKKSSIDLFYRFILNKGKNVINFHYSEALLWFNIGNVEEYLECIQHFLKQENLSSCTNLSFSMPKNLQEIINEYTEKNDGLLEKIDGNKISISFRDLKKEPTSYVSMNEVSGFSSAKDIIYFYL